MASAAGSTPTLEPVDQPKVDESTLELALLSDLTKPVPPDVTFDFDVQGVKLGESGANLAVLIDNNTLATFPTATAKIPGLADGYHLLRAFLFDDEGLCIKSPLAYVEAEFYVRVPLAQAGPREFMFGQPSLCHLAPRGRIHVDDLDAIPVDFFVNNCELGTSAHGYSVNVYADDKLIQTLTDWKAHDIRNFPEKGAGEFVTIKLGLVNPAGEEVVTPIYNAQAQKCEVTEDDDA